MDAKAEFEQERREERRNAPYIQFPLPLLALFHERFQLMEGAINYGVVRYARNLHPNARGDRRHEAIAAAQAKLDLDDAVGKSLKCWRMVRKRLTALGVDADNRTVQVRIPMKRAYGLLGEWEELNNNDVRVLLAITSKIGNQELVVMTRREIAFRAAGAKDEKQWRAFGSPRLLSETQIARSINKLAERMGLISRVLGRKGTLNFFSHTLTFDELFHAAQEWQGWQSVAAKPMPVMRV